MSDSSSITEPSTPLILRDWLAQAPFTLSMSSGYFGFFAHLGMLQALQDAGLTPTRYTGASAGALVAGLSAAGCDLNTLKERLFTISKEDFWDPGLGFGLLKGGHFRKMIKDLLPIQLIQDCPIPLALSTYDIKQKQTQVYQSGELVPLIYASCALPILFQPIKYDNRWLSDGGIKDRPALASVQDDERVLYHHIASRSPWRRKNSPALELPKKNNLVGIAIEGLPRSGPNKLHKGQEAWLLANQTMKHLLQQPYQESYRLEAITT